MLQRMRKGAQSMGAKVLAGVICFVLVVFGFGAFNLFGVDEPAAAKVNGTDITQSQLANSVATEKRRLAAQWGDSVTPEQLDAFVTPQQELRGLIDRELLLQIALDLGLTSSRTEFLDVVTRHPSFQDENSNFDPETYAAALAAQGMSPQSFEAVLTDDARVRQLFEVFSDTSFVTEFERRDLAAVRYQRRDYAYLVVSPSDFEAEIQITIEDVSQHYEANLDKFITEETFDFTGVTLVSAGMADDIPITEEEVEELYETELAAAKAGAPRSSSHILLEINDDRSLEDAVRKLQEVRAKVLAGESFEEFAKELSDGPSGPRGGSLGSATPETYVKPYSDALWALESIGDLSEPTQTDFGVHLIRLDEKGAVDHPGFEERREDILKERRGELELEMFEQALERFDKVAFEQSDSLQPLVEEFGVRIDTFENITRRHREGVFAQRPLQEAAFEDDVLKNGFNSRTVAIGTGRAIVVRLERVNESVQKSLEEVSEEIEGHLRSVEAARLVENAVEQARSQLEQEGADYSAVADELGVEWENVEGGRRDARQPRRSIIAAAFETPAPSDDSRELTTTQLPNGAGALIVVSRVVLARFDETSETERETMDRQLAQTAEHLGYGLLIESLRTEADVVSFIPDFDPEDPMFQVTSQPVAN